MLIRRSHATILLVCMLTALVSTAINRPLARYPWQDLLWNDLVLANRVAWLSDALKKAPLASIDHLQGLGNAVYSDIKVIPHFYEPAVWFAAAGLDVNAALDLRNLVLVLYCACCLYGLYRSVTKADPGTFSPLFLIVLASYTLAPQLLGEVSHHFSAVYLAVPGWLLALRAFAREPRARTALIFSGASTLFVHLSDVHVAFIAPTLVILAWCMDRQVRSASYRVLFTSALVFGTITALSYLAVPLSMLQRDPNLVVSEGTWALDYYWQTFMRNALWTLLFPTFEGPVCLYLTPLLFFLLAPLATQATCRAHALRLALFVGLLAALTTLGLVFHGIEPLRNKLPSAMRYHLTAIPFLAVLFLLYTQAEVEIALAGIRRSWPNTLAWILAYGAFFWWIAQYKFNPESEAFIVFERWLIEPGVFAWRRVGLSLLVLLPFTVMIFGLAGPWLDRSAWSRLAGAALLIAVMAGGYYGIRAFSVPRHNLVYIDTDFRNRLGREIPAQLSALIAESQYTSAPRSIVPIAQGVANLPVGRNDKLLPLIELPETLAGRSFLHWRYSYSAQTKAMYSHLTGRGPVNFFPPTPNELEQTLAFARLTDSPFLLSADAALTHPSLEKLGAVAIRNPIIAKRPLILNDGLNGTFFLYAIPDIATSSKRPDAIYRRTSAQFSNLPPAPEGWSRLPITYFPALRAYDQRGNKVELRRDTDGFVSARNDGSLESIAVSSFSLLGLWSLLCPVAGWSVWWLATQVLPRLRPGRPATLA